MSEPTTEASASGEEAVASETAAALEKTALSIPELIEAGVHFGHQTRRWNPRMKSFLFGERNGVHIVDLDQTLPRFEEALDFLREVTTHGGKVLFVGTKRQAQAAVKLESERGRQFFVNNRWLGGMLTNFKTVKKSIERYKGSIRDLGPKELQRVLVLLQNKLNDQLKARGLRIELSEAVRQELIDASYREGMGARSIQRLFDRRVRDAIVDQLFSEALQPGDYAMELDEERAMVFRSRF